MKTHNVMIIKILSLLSLYMFKETEKDTLCITCTMLCIRSKVFFLMTPFCMQTPVLFTIVPLATHIQG